jgi:hypothetical protein
VGAGAAALLAVGAAAMFMRGGGSEPTAVNEVTTDAGGNADIVLGGATPDANATDAANAAAAEANLAAAEPTPEATAQTSAADALRKEQAKAAAAQKAGASIGPTKTPTKSASASASTSSASSESSGGGVSSAKLSQFYGIVDSARSMAKQVMRSGNSQNAQLARSYDANLKTLRDSIRGVNSDRDADRLIKQASQTRAYVQFLVKQSQ